MSSSVLPRSDPFYRNHLIRDGISQALYDAMSGDSSIHLFGEGCEVKQHYDAPQIEQDFSDRVHTMPISEDGTTNFCVGTALMGVKPVVDVIAADFLYRTLDSICNTAAKSNFVRPDQEPSTIVIRSEFLTGGPSTGQRLEALFTHIPGLRVALPSTPRDAYSLMRAALRTPGVTLFFEDRMIRDDQLTGEDCRLIDQPYFGHDEFGWAFERPAFQWKLKGYLPDVTVITYGLMRQRVESALLSAGDLRVDVLDLRTLYPIDWGAVMHAALNSKRVMVVEPDVTHGGVGAEIVARIAEMGRSIQVRRIGSPRTTIPASMALHAQTLLSSEEILHAICDFAAE